jgi:hypothetical protein
MKVSAVPHPVWLTGKELVPTAARACTPFGPSTCIASSVSTQYRVSGICTGSVSRIILQKPCRVVNIRSVVGPVTEPPTHLDEEVAGAVDDSRLLVEAVHAVDKGVELHHPLDLVQITQLPCHGAPRGLRQGRYPLLTEAE